MQGNREMLALGTMHFKEANQLIREALEQVDALCLRDVFAQRFIGCAMPEGKALEIHGTPGNDMAAYMDGGVIEVFGNAQDQIGNTMNAGTVTVHGRCGDAAGYAMRGGTLLVRDGCGWRVGINMKQYEDKRPVIVIGGDAGSFLGEYMAGGVIVLMGHAGPYLGTGMHGGKMYLAQEPAPENISDGLELLPLDEADVKELGTLLHQYYEAFPEKKDEALTAAKFKKLIPSSSRPYAALYTSGS